MAFRSNPWVQKVVAAGEAQLDRLTSQILGNERFVAAVQTAVSRTLAAKGTMDKSIRAVLATMNLPSVQDIDDLRSRLDELDRSISELAAKISEVEKGIAAPAPKATRTRAKASASGDKASPSGPKKTPAKKKA